MRYCGYITREGKFIDLNKKYPDLEEIWMSKHTQFEEDFGIDEDYILIYNKWVKLTTCLDEYIYMGVEPLTNAQQETLLKLGYKIEEFDI